MHRVLLDTNVLIAAAYNRSSASARIVDRVERRELTMIVSPAIEHEYERLFPKAIRYPAERKQIWKIVELAEAVVPESNPPVTEDRDDDKFLAAAVAANAEVIISNDQHLLAVHPYRGIDILRPAAFWRRYLDVEEHSD